MPLAVSPVSRTDLPTLVRIFNAAFEKDPMMSKRYPHGINDDALAESVAEYADALRDPSCHYIAVTDTETGHIISFARWNEYLNGRPDEEWQKPFTPEDSDSAANRYDNDFFSRLYEERSKRWKGNPVSCQLFLARSKDNLAYGGRSRLIYHTLLRHADLTILATSPVQARRGAASLLIRWGTDRADKANVPVYLEATIASLQLYQRNGFVQVGEIVTDLHLYEAEGIERVALMQRKPIKQ